jgi:hypothetical protein
MFSYLLGFLLGILTGLLILAIRRRHSTAKIKTYPPEGIKYEIVEDKPAEYFPLAAWFDYGDYWCTDWTMTESLWRYLILQSE